MKMITIEEHISDQPLMDASLGIIEEVAPFFIRSTVPGLPAYPPPGSLQDMDKKRIADMDANGIDMQIISCSNAPQLLPAAEAIPLTQNANDRMAEAVRRNPGRFAAFATLPLCDPRAAARELERTITQLGFKGALITGRPSKEAIFLDDEQFSPVLEMAASLDIPLYLHPGFPVKSVEEAYYERLDPLVSARLAVFGWGWHAEAGVQIVRMILAGVFEKYPKLQLIAGHWGEMVPFFLDRLDEVMPPTATNLPKNVSEYFKNHVYVTPSGMFALPHLKFIMKVLGADRIIYSVDYPYLGNEGARDFLENAPISQEDKEKIAHGNAERLFKIK